MCMTRDVLELQQGFMQFFQITASSSKLIFVLIVQIIFQIEAGDDVLVITSSIFPLVITCISFFVFSHYREGKTVLRAGLMTQGQVLGRYQETLNSSFSAVSKPILQVSSTIFFRSFLSSTSYKAHFHIFCLRVQQLHLFFTGIGFSVWGSNFCTAPI